MAEWIWHRLVRGCRRVWQCAEWAKVMPADWPRRIMTVEVTDRFHAKQGRSTGRWIVTHHAGRVAVYLKRHYQLSWWHGLLALIWPNGDWSPAGQERKRLAWAANQGVPVPRVMAGAEFVGPGCRLQSVLAVEELAGMLPLNEAIPLAAERKSSREFARWKRGLTAEMARLTNLLHGCHRYHKDLYLCHFYIPEAFTRTLPDWTGQVWMIDFHRLTAHRWTWPVWQIKDLAELLYSSSVEGVVVRDRVRFWRYYLRGQRSQRTTRLLRWLILAKWRRYRDHNARRQNRNRATLPQPSQQIA
jgi:heptose I phosphotransferase